jgi:hypothetical protein
MGTSRPRKQCFCDAGYFGDKCEKVSTLTDATIDESQYTLRVVLSDKLTMFARIINDEIEIALYHNGTSYAAVGWKPVGEGHSFHSFSDYRVVIVRPFA